MNPIAGERGRKGVVGPDAARGGGSAEGHDPSRKGTAMSILLGRIAAAAKVATLAWRRWPCRRPRRWRTAEGMAGGAWRRRWRRACRRGARRGRSCRRGACRRRGRSSVLRRRGRPSGLWGRVRPCPFPCVWRPCGVTRAWRGPHVGGFVPNSHGRGYGYGAGVGVGIGGWGHGSGYRGYGYGGYGTGYRSGGYGYASAACYLTDPVTGLVYYCPYGLGGWAGWGSGLLPYGAYRIG